MKLENLALLICFFSISCAPSGSSHTFLQQQDTKNHHIEESGDTSTGTDLETPVSQPVTAPERAPQPFPADEFDDPDLPSISIRMPSLRKDKILAYAPDADEENSNIPFIGSEGAAKPEPGNQILVSTIEIESNSTPNNSLSLASFTSDSERRAAGSGLEGRGLGRGWKFALHWHSLLPTANAKAIHPCKQPGNYCFPINADGSFEAYLPTLESHENIYAAVVDEKGNLSGPLQEKVQEALLWLKNQPKDLATNIIPSPPEGEGQGEGAPAPTLYALTKNIGVQINATDKGLQVAGNHKNNYQSFTSPQTEQLAYEPIQKLLATRRPALDILLNPKGFIPPGEALAPLQQSITVPEAKSYTVLKTATNGKIYFGIETKPDDEQALRWGRIRYATDPDSMATIVFLANDFIQGLDKNITHSKTLAFDVDAEGWALVAFEDTLGETRLRMGKNKGLPPLRLGGEQPLNGNFNLKDLQIYQENVSGTEQGRALIIDSLESRIGIISFNYKLGSDKHIVLNDWINLGENKSPQSLALNPGKTKAYIANKNDDTLSILTLKENNVLKTPMEIQQSIQTIQLADFIKDKKFSIQPNKILYQKSFDGDYLVIASEGLKGAMIIPIEKLELFATAK